MQVNFNKGMIMSEECVSYEGCSATLCPLEIDSNHVWFPDEDICRKHGKVDWIKKQRKIARKANNKDTYFTVDMLKEVKRVTANIVGADPDRVNDQTWIKGRVSSRI